MATATPQPSPNPNALRFQLDVTLPGTISYASATEAADHPFAAAVFTADGVANLFGVNDFVTVNRTPGADWDPIIAAVQQAAAEQL
ncbi:MAG: NifU N-terminal domain-containing protein [Acidimicrobiales bacterium]